MSRIPQVKKFKTLDELRARLDELGCSIPLADLEHGATALASPTSFTDATAGTFPISNRFAILPMEGWDGTTEGGSTELVQRRWQRFGDSGAGLVWGEATAVVAEGRANPNQLVCSSKTVDDLAALRALLAPDQVCGLQLTHSGRYARPTSLGPAPRTLYEHPVLDQRTGASAETIMTDGEIDELVATFIDRAGLVHQAGFDFVDVKACHGYLGHEFLSAYDRTGRYGGDFAGRTRFLRSIVEGIRAAVPELAIALRLSIFDLIPFHAGPDGIGIASAAAPYRHGFGTNDEGEPDLAETHALLDLVGSLGIGLLCTTAGSPYYCPHTQRPAYFPPSDGYQPPEDPLVGVARLINATAELNERQPNLTIVGSGYSYLQQWLPHAAEATVAAGGADLAGLGRMALSYPHMPRDVLAGAEIDNRLICRTFSDCTTAPRAGLVSGCFPLDPFYKDHPQRVELAATKKALRAAKQGIT